MAGGRRINVTVEADTDGDFGKAADGLDDVARSGDKADGALRRLTKGHRTLDAEIGKVGHSIKAMRSEFEKTGDLGLLGDIDKQSRTLNKLKSQLTGFASEAGTESGKVFTFGLFKTFQSLPPQAQAALVGGLGAVAAAAGPLIGSLVTAGIAGAVGGGVLAVGIKLAAKDPQVSAAWDDFARHAGDKLTENARVFREPLIKAAEDWKAAFDRIDPSIERSFDRIAPSLDKLSKGAQGFLDKLSPGIEDAVGTARPVLDQLGKDLPGLGKDISGFFHQLSGDGESAAAGLHAAFNLVGATLTAVGAGVSSLTRSFGALDAVARGNFTTAIARLMGIKDASTQVADVARTTAEKVLEEARKQHDAGVIAADGWRLQQEALQRYYTGAMSLFGLNLGLRNTFFELKAAVEQNGKSLDLSTEGGIRNAQVVQQQAQKIKDWRDQQVTAKGDSQALRDSVESQRESLIRNAHQVGLNEQTVDAWTRAWGLVPDETHATAVTHTETALARIGGLEKRLDAIDGRTASTYVYNNVITRFSTIGSRPAGPTVGFVKDFAKGGIVEAARGLIARPGPLIKFAEPQTGGEALIPRRGISDDRAASLLKTAAGWHGMDVAPRRSGYGSQVSPGAGGGKMTLEVAAAGGSGSRLMDAIVEGLALRIRTDRATATALRVA